MSIDPQAARDFGNPASGAAPSPSDEPLFEAGSATAGDDAGDSHRIRFLDWLVRQQNDEAVRLRMELRRRTDERDALRLELDRTWRMAEIGLLAAGSAHDLRNLLLASGGLASLARETLPQDSRERELLDDSVHAADRASELIGQLLKLAHADDHGSAPLDLSEAVADAVSLVESAVPDDVRVECHWAGPLPPLRASSSAICRMVMNLVMNAVQALEGRGGRIEVRTGSDAEPPSVWFEVRDDGPGMPEAVLRRAGDPFFSTRLERSGLGLAVVRRLAAARGGVLDLWSEPGRGTRARVAFRLES